ncbi:recombinase family protein [Ectobacillus sp. JY-23]
MWGSCTRKGSVQSVTSNKRKNINPKEHVVTKNAHEAIISFEDFKAVK